MSKSNFKVQVSTPSTKVLATLNCTWLIPLLFTLFGFIPTVIIMLCLLRLIRIFGIKEAMHLIWYASLGICAFATYLMSNQLEANHPLVGPVFSTLLLVSSLCIAIFLAYELIYKVFTR